MRLLVYVDYPYRRLGEDLHAELAFSVLVAEAGRSAGSLTLVGRLDRDACGPRHPMPADAEFVPLPHYRSLGRPWRALPALASSVRRFDRALAGADLVWLFGPHPLSVVFACIATVRKRPLVLGVRQNYLRYVRYRYPRRPSMWLAGAILHLAFLGLARRATVVTVGPSISYRYRRAKRVHELVPSLVRASGIVAVERALARDYSGELTLLSVGRLDPEKNPLLLADVLARLIDRDPRWKLVICGEGSLQPELRSRLRLLGVAERVEFRGYLATPTELGAEYRAAHAFLHVSLTEGAPAPQVLFEAFAAGLPVVATDVDDLREISAACLLVGADDPDAAVSQLLRIATESGLRRELVERGHEIVARHTMEAEADRLARFLCSAADVSSVTSK